jgi:3-methyladenine DNA glycosylase AlkD
MSASIQAVLDRLKTLSNPDNVAGMARFGINPQNTLGIYVATLRQIAKEIGRDQTLALELWNSRIHEARLLASFIADPHQMTEALLEDWVKEFDSWDICDQVCGLFARTPYAYVKAQEWSSRPETFVKRAGFVLMATLAVHDKRAPNEHLAQFLPAIAREAGDERHFIRKAVNWALRQIGKHSLTLNIQAIETARQIQHLDSKAARWIAADALRELTSAPVQTRLLAKASSRQHQNSLIND